MIGHNKNIVIIIIIIILLQFCSVWFGFSLGNVHSLLSLTLSGNAIFCNQKNNTNRNGYYEKDSN